MAIDQPPIENNDFSSAVVGAAGLFYATSATMFLAATQTWTIHLARQSFLGASKTALYVAIGLTFLEAVLILARPFITTNTAFKVMHVASLGVVGLATIYGMSSLYADLLPLEVCASSDAPECVTNPPRPL